MRIARFALCLVVASASSFWPWASSAVEPAPRHRVIGQSHQGRPLTCQVFGGGPKTLLVLATIHGNEAAGTPLVEQFARWLTEHPEELKDVRVVLLPVANPDGMAGGARTNARGIDLNRNFPAVNWTPSTIDAGTGAKLHGPMPLSEPESRALMRVLCTFYPDLVVTIHQPLACVDFDGPGEELAAQMSACCDLPVNKLGSLPGSLGSFVGNTWQRPIITLELPPQAGRDGPQLWKQYGGALRAALHYATAGKSENAGK